MSLRHAESIKVRIEDMASANMAGHAPADETSRWLAGLDEGMRDRLARVGRLTKRPKATPGAFIDAYVARRSDVKASTRLVYGRVRAYLIDYFGPDRSLRDISPGDADAWRLSLIEKGLADNTIRRSCGRTYDQPERRNWPTGSPSTWFLRGPATAFPSRSSTTCK